MLKHFLQRFRSSDFQDTLGPYSPERRKLPGNHEAAIEQQLVDIAWQDYRLGIKTAVFRRIRNQSYLLALIRPNASRVPKPQAPEEFSQDLLNSYNAMAEQTGQTKLSTIIWTESQSKSDFKNTVFPSIDNAVSSKVSLGDN